jgi:futalosine hydrolase
MPFESNKILRQFKNARRVKLAGKTVYRGKLLNQPDRHGGRVYPPLAAPEFTRRGGATRAGQAGVEALLMNTGIGKVNAALCAVGLIEKFPITNIINLGVGGAYPASGLKTGDIAVASKEIYGDEGVISSGGWEGLKKIGIPLVQSGNKKYFNEFPLDKKLAEKAYRLLKSGTQYAVRSTRTTKGIFVTVSAVTGTHNRALELERRFNAVCENMEGAALAQVCAIYKIPFLEIRGISNIVGVRDKRKWDLNLASENCQDAVLAIIRAV